MGVSFLVCLGFVVEDMYETVSYLQEVDMTGHEIGFKWAGEPAMAVIGNVLSCEIDGYFDCDCDGIIDEHEALQRFVTFLVAWRRGKHKLGSARCVVFLRSERRAQVRRERGGALPCLLEESVRKIRRYVAQILFQCRKGVRHQ